MTIEFAGSPSIIKCRPYYVPASGGFTDEEDNTAGLAG